MRNKNNSSSHSTDQKREELSPTLLAKRRRLLLLKINPQKVVRGEDLEGGIAINHKRVSLNTDSRALLQPMQMKCRLKSSRLGRSL